MPIFRSVFRTKYGAALMKKLSVSEDIIPVGEFKSGISRYLKSLRETGRPLVITQNGRPAGVLLSPNEYDHLVHSSTGQPTTGPGEVHKPMNGKRR